MTLQSASGRRGAIVGTACVLLAAARAYASPPRVPAAPMFQDVSATADGGAWLLVRTSVTRTELRRIDADGDVTRVAAPAPFGAIAAAADGTVWGVTARAVLHRDAAGAWTTIALAAPTKQFATGYGTTSQVLTPLARDRLLVLRGCETATACSEAYVVDAAAATAGDVTTFDWVVGPAVPDGRGGAWALLHRGSGTNEQDGYAHYGAAGWESWTYAGLPVAGMTDRGKTTVAPEAIAVGGDGGFVGATTHELVAVGADGQPGQRVPNSPHESFATSVLGLARVGDHYATVFGLAYARRDRTHDTSPVIAAAWLAGGHALQEERASTPAWWRRANDARTPTARVSGAGVELYVMTSELLMYKTHNVWRELGAVPEHPPVSERVGRPVATALSLPIELGVGQTQAAAGAADTDPSTGFAIGFRPELMIVPNHRRPSFGVGVYGEVEHQPAITPYGGGVTLVGYTGVIGLAISAGVDRVQANPQLVVSGFVGIRTRLDELPLDIPMGLRIDVRPQTDHVPGSVMVSASIDLIAGSIIAAALAGH